MATLCVISVDMNQRDGDAAASQVLTIKPLHPVVGHGDLVLLPETETVTLSSDGTGTFSLYPGHYECSVTLADGCAQSFSFSVPSADTANLADLVAQNVTIDANLVEQVRTLLAQTRNSEENAADFAASAAASSASTSAETGLRRISAFSELSKFVLGSPGAGEVQVQAGDTIFWEEEYVSYTVQQIPTSGGQYITNSGGVIFAANPDSSGFNCVAFGSPLNGVDDDLPGIIHAFVAANADIPNASVYVPRDGVISNTIETGRAVLRGPEARVRITALPTFNGGKPTLLNVTGAVAGNVVESRTQIRLTVVGHGLSDDDEVGVQNVGGVPSSERIWFVDVIDVDTIELQRSVFDPSYTYTGGGTVHLCAAPMVRQGDTGASGTDSNFNSNIELRGNGVASGIDLLYRNASLLQSGVFNTFDYAVRLGRNSHHVAFSEIRNSGEADDADHPSNLEGMGYGVYLDGFEDQNADSSTNVLIRLWGLKIAHMKRGLQVHEGNMISVMGTQIDATTLPVNIDPLAGDRIVSLSFTDFQIETSNDVPVTTHIRINESDINDALATQILFRNLRVKGLNGVGETGIAWKGNIELRVEGYASRAISKMFAPENATSMRGSYIAGIMREAGSSGLAEVFDASDAAVLAVMDTITWGASPDFITKATVTTNIENGNFDSNAVPHGMSIRPTFVLPGYDLDAAATAARNGGITASLPNDTQVILSTQGPSPYTGASGTVRATVQLQFGQ